jgi:D-ribose pyranase
MRSNGGILHGQLSRVLSEMGHTDRLVVSDAGLPVPMLVERVDLALRPGLPAFLNVLDAVLAELSVEAVTLSSEMREASPEMLEAVLTRLGDRELSYVSHIEFKTRTKDARAIVRSGEFTPFANVILTAGVVY